MDIDLLVYLLAYSESECHIFDYLLVYSESECHIFDVRHADGGTTKLLYYLL